MNPMNTTVCNRPGCTLTARQNSSLCEAHESMVGYANVRRAVDQAYRELVEHVRRVESAEATDIPDCHGATWHDGSCQHTAQRSNP